MIQQFQKYYIFNNIDLINFNIAKQIAHINLIININGQLNIFSYSHIFHLFYNKKKLPSVHRYKENENNGDKKNVHRPQKKTAT